MTIDIEVLPLFSSPLGVVSVPEKIFDIDDFLSQRAYFFSTDSATSKGTYGCTTEEWDILKYFPEQKNTLMSLFNIYKNDVLKLNTTDFQMTTSWITKVDPGGWSEFHNHKNCMYSAVYYFDKMLGGNIEFQSMGIRPEQFVINDPTDWNVLNSNTWTHIPKEGQMIIFPSYVYHRVSINNSNEERYSLAMNFFPVGKIGRSDCTLIARHQYE